jgi:site-specific recombinase XerD
MPANRRRLDADLLNPTEIERLLQQCSSRAPTGVRNRALIGLLWRTGLRIGEALALLPKDIDLEAGLLVVQHGKGDVRRVVGIDTGTAALMSRWLDARKKLGLRAATPLFCTLAGGAVESSYVRHLLPRLAKKAGVEKRVHAHGLRHRHAVDLIQEGAPITTVRDLLGHSSVAVTDRYLTRVGASEAVEFARARVWLSGAPDAAPAGPRKPG